MDDCEDLRLNDPIFVKAVMKTQWLEDTEFNLYIPHPWGDDWVKTGCDQHIESVLDKWWREFQEHNAFEELPPVPQEVYFPLGLREVPDVLKRHNEVDGFYHA